VPWRSCTRRDSARILMAERPPSTDSSTPFTKLESSEARNTATTAISSGRPIFPRGIPDSNIRFASSVRTWSCIGVAIGAGLSRFTRIFLPFSSLSHVRAKERNAALLAAYTPKPGKPLTEATEPVMKIDPPSMNSFRPGQARGHSPVGRNTGEADRRKSHAFRQKDVTHRFGALRHAFARQLQAECGRAEPIPLTGGNCILLARGTSIVLRDSPRTRPRWSFSEIAAKANSNVAHYGGGGAPTTIVCGSLSFDRAGLKPVTQLLPSFILIKAEEARARALHNTMQALASEMAEQAPESAVVANRLAEVLFIQVLRAHIASGPERKKGWLRAIFDPQIGTALSAIHDRVNTPWTVESLAGAAAMSRSAFAARFKELLGQTPLEYVTEWRMQKAMQLLQERDKKLIDIARSVGYESDAAFSKAFKRVVGANPGEYLKRGFEGHSSAGMAEELSRSLAPGSLRGSRNFCLARLR
jgi:AraC-like DNA-binding protein